MNGRQKGKRIELEFRKMLESHGFLVNPTPPGTRFNLMTDHWGLFDMEAIAPQHSEFTMFIQIATRWKSGQDLKEIEAFPHSPYRKIYMVRRKDNSPFELKEYVMHQWLDFDLDGFFKIYGNRKIGG